MSAPQSTGDISACSSTSPFVRAAQVEVSHLPLSRLSTSVCPQVDEATHNILVQISAYPKFVTGCGTTQLEPRNEITVLREASAREWIRLLAPRVDRSMLMLLWQAQPRVSGHSRCLSLEKWKLLS